MRLSMQYVVHLREGEWKFEINLRDEQERIIYFKSVFENSLSCEYANCDKKYKYVRHAAIVIRGKFEKYRNTDDNPLVKKFGICMSYDCLENEENSVFNCWWVSLKDLLKILRLSGFTKKTEGIIFGGMSEDLRDIFYEK